MKAEQVNIFVKSATHVFEQEIGVQMTRQSISRKDSPTPGFPISIVIGITGMMRGQVVYAIDEDFAMNIAHKMLPNRLPSELKKIMASAVGELGNMITGQAMMHFAGEEGRIEITPPAVVTGSGLKVEVLETPTVSLQMLSQMGSLEINVALIDGVGEAAA